MLAPIIYPDIISYIKIHNVPNEKNETMYDLLKTTDLNFGIITIKTPKVQITKTPLAIYMNIDRSGSMDDICPDGQTKMAHLKHTIKNMIHLFSTYTEVNVYICIGIFGSFVDILTNGFELITIETLEYFYKIINSITSQGNTNIELSLQTAMNSILTFKKKSPNVRPIHIQFTDGEASSGETEINELIKNINTSYKNIFIGFGETHDSYLLSRFAEYDNVGINEYIFIDQTEKADMVCGEIIYNILYPFTTECSTINMIPDEDGKSMKIYNWKTNEWVSNITISPLSGDCEKIYHIQGNKMVNIKKKNLYCRSSSSEISENIGNICSAELLLCDLYGDKYIEYIELIPELINIPKASLDNKGMIETNITDLTKYMFRQKTLELLYESQQLESHQYEIKEKENNIDNWMNKKYTSHVNKDIIDLRSRFLILFKILQVYFDTLVNECDKIFIKILMDDIHIANKTLGTSNGYMYSCSRHISQGSQGTYKVGVTNDDVYQEENISSKTNNIILEMMHKICNNQEDVEVEC